MRTPIPYCQIPADWWGDFSQCLHEWQTIIVAAPAIAIGIATVCVGYKNIKKLSHQIKSSEELEKSRINRNFKAHRSMLPLDLAPIFIYCDEILKNCKLIIQNDQDHKIIFNKTLAPDKPLENLKLFLTYSDNNILNNYTIRIFSNVQSISARAEEHNSDDFDEGNDTFNNVSEIILLCAETIVMISYFFQYARFETNEIPEQLEWKEVQTFLMLSDLKAELNLEKVSALIRICKASSPYFWTAQ